MIMVNTLIKFNLLSVIRSKLLDLVSKNEFKKTENDKNNESELNVNNNNNEK